MPFLYAIGFAATLGAVIGSFLNVVIYRVPRGESIVHPRSRCPGCGWALPAWANVPIVSYAALRGRCHGCGEPISLRYPAVELLCAALFVALVWFEPPGLRLFAHWALLAALVAVAFIDLEHQIIPNAITFPGIGIGLALSFVAPPPTPLLALVGALLPGGLMWAIAAYYEWRTGQIGLGMGDVKLVAMLGAFLGVEPAFGIMILGSLIGLIHGAILIALRGGGRKTRIPFGPALAAAGIAIVFWPELPSSAFDWLRGALAG